MLWRSAILLFCSFYVCHTNSAGLLEDQTASWKAAGLAESLVAGHENALPEALLVAVTASAPELLSHTADSHHTTYKFGKRNTWWLPLKNEKGKRPKPRSALEAAVHYLFDLEFGGKSTPIVGAEWWFQDQPLAGSIGYHYDKDEAYASEHMTMRFPEVSTVTYLTDVGAPTLVLNQTTPDGNEEVPPVPAMAALIHPSRNKHLLFRGNLHHGVTGELLRSAPGGTSGSEAGNRRLTLLINYWRYQPMPPNLMPFESDRWERARLSLGTEAVQALVHSESRDVPPPIQWASLWSSHSASAQQQNRDRIRQIAIELPPTDLVYLAFPPQEHMRAGSWLVQWEPGMAFGPIARLDLFNQRSLTAIFNDKRPKLFFVLPSKGARLWMGAVPRWLDEFLGQFSEAVKVVFAEPSDTADFMRQFALTAADAPTAVIHDTSRNGRKYRMGGKLSRARAWKFVQDFIAGRLQKEEL